MSDSSIHLVFRVMYKDKQLGKAEIGLDSSLIAQQLDQRGVFFKLEASTI